MEIVEYGEKYIDQKVWNIIDNSKPFTLVVKGNSRYSIFRGLTYYDDYFEERKNGHKNLWKWMKFACYAIRHPVFWGIINHAELASMSIDYHNEKEFLEVIFTK